MNTKHMLLVAALLTSLAACKKPEEPVGPAQKAGAAIDNAGAQAAQQMQDTLHKADEAAEKIREHAKVTGEEIKEATEDVRRDASRSLDKATEEVGRKVEHAGEKMQESSRRAN